jgi:hypothetical protein
MILKNTLSDTIGGNEQIKKKNKNKTKRECRMED